MHQNAAAGGTDFALVDKYTEESAVDCSFKVCVGEEDVRGFSAEFQSDALYRIRGLLDDHLADSSAAGEGDFVHVWVLNERGTTGFPEPGDDVDHARRQANVRQPVGHFERGEWCLFGWLQYTCATGGECRSKFPGRHQQRIVPGNDLPRNADRLFEGQAHGVVGNGIHVSQNLGGQATVIFEAGGDVVDVKFGFDDGLAAVAGFEFRQHDGVLSYFFCETEEHATALLCGCGSPRAIFECGFRGGRGAVYVFGISVGDLGDYFFSGGVVNGECLARFAVHPLAVNVHLISANFGFHSTGHVTSCSGLASYARRGLHRANPNVDSSQAQPFAGPCGAHTHKRKMPPDR